MPTLSSPGIGSGLDIQSLVQSLVQAEAAPATQRLDRKELQLTTKISALGQFKSAFADLADALDKLTKTETYRTRSFTSSNEDVLTGSADTTAATGIYDINVTTLAKSQALVTSTSYASRTDVVGEGTITITFGTDPTGSFTANPDKSPITITIDSTNNTLEGVRDAINAADAGVRASIVNTGSGYVLALSAEDTGAANAMKIDVVETGTAGLSALAYNATAQNMQQTRAAQDAQVTIDGVTVTSPDNTLDDTIDGLSLTLVDQGSAQVTVALDKGAVTKAVKAFVDAYNSFRDTVDSLTGYDPDTRQAGPLNGDSGVRAIANAVRRQLGTAIEGLSGGLRSLTDIGVSIDSDGRMSLDSGKLEQALDADPASVEALLVGQGKKGETNYVAGIATRLDDYFTAVEDDDLIGSRIDTLNDRVDDLKDDRDRLSRRLEQLQNRLTKQFTALDLLVGQLQNTSAWLQQQLASLPTIQVKTGSK